MRYDVAKLCHIFGHLFYSSVVNFFLIKNIMKENQEYLIIQLLPLCVEWIRVCSLLLIIIRFYPRILTKQENSTIDICCLLNENEMQWIKNVVFRWFYGRHSSCTRGSLWCIHLRHGNWFVFLSSFVYPGLDFFMSNIIALKPIIFSILYTSITYIQFKSRLKSIIHRCFFSKRWYT